MSAKQGLMRWLSGFIALDTAAIGIIIVAHQGIDDLSVRRIVGTILGLVAPPALLLFSALIPPEIKASLVFWRIFHPLPGHRAFSQHVRADARIDPSALERRLGRLPSDPADQNALWFRLYREHQNEASVLDAHRQYLLFRDLACVSLMLAVVAPVVFVYVDLTIAAWPAYVVFFVQYLFAAVAARQAGFRFVRNVLAIESTR